METTAERTWQVDDLVLILPGFYPRSVSTMTPFKITKVPSGAREVNYQAVPVNGGRGVRGPAHVFAPYDESKSTADLFGETLFLEPGTVVTVRHPKFGPDDLYVVIGNSSKGGNKLVKLGGDGGRYWPSIPASLCTVIEPARLKVEE